MSETKIKELQEFVDDFNKKLKEAYNKFEDKQKKIKKLKKSHSQIEHSYNKTNGDKFPLVSNNNYKIIHKTKSSKFLSTNIKTNPQIWKPPNGYPDYFEDFKRLHNQYQLSSWEKVCKYIIIKFIL